jgi:integrase
VTSPRKNPIVVADIAVTADTPVIVNRTILSGTADSDAPRFGDAVWNLAPAIEDRHSAAQRLWWREYPAGLREQTKIYVFALVNVVEDAPRLPFARSPYPQIKTIWSDLVSLRVLLKWLDERGITSFSAVTSEMLDDYARYIQDSSGSTAWQRKALLAVQRLQTYRDCLPPDCRLPSTRLWEGKSAAELADDPGPDGTNRTPRINAAFMETLLSAALLTTTHVAKDVLPVAERLLAFRSVAHSVAPPERRKRVRGAERYPASKRQLECLIPAMAGHKLPIPAIKVGGALVPDEVGFGIGGWIEKDMFTRSFVRQTIAESRIAYRENWLVVQRFSKVNDRRWHRGRMSADDVVATVRRVITACFLVTAYLSGVRTGEALNLRRGCITHDKKLGLVFMTGEQLKASAARRERSAATIPWVVVPEVAHAVTVLETLTTGDFLFPSGRFCSAAWFTQAAARARTPGSMNDDLRDFVEWFNNDIAEVIGHPPIPDDADGPLAAPRLRRTLAWHIVHRPGGLIAGATQYGHVHTQIMQGYAGYADSGFANELEFENVLTQAQTIHDDAARLDAGEVVSGPAAGEYKSRIANRPIFLGATIPSPNQVKRLLANPALAIHRGALLTCVYRPETAACQSQRKADTPDWGRCRLGCPNIAYTDRDIENVRTESARLTTLIANDALPVPLQDRVRQRRDHLDSVIADHTAQSPETP